MGNINIPRSLMFLTLLFFRSFGASVVMLAVMLCPKWRAGLDGSRLGLCNGCQGNASEQREQK